jgi:hypothetical protein
MGRRRRTKAKVAEDVEDVEEAAAYAAVVERALLPPPPAVDCWTTLGCIKKCDY